MHFKRNKGKHILALLLAAAILGTSVGCQSQGEKEETGSEYMVGAEDADVWCAPASAKVLATQSSEQYADVRLDKIILNAAKNEYETGQIIVSAKKDLKFTVSVGDLVHTEDKDAVILAENCTVYTQKYVSVSTISHGNGAPTGKYPDGLVPQENAVKYELNRIAAGENGGAWLEFFIPKDAKTGDYTGTAKVDLGKEAVEVGIELKVFNVEMPDETTSKALFTINEGMLRTYELDASEDIYDRYTEFLIKHRLSPSGLINRSELAEEGDSEYRIWAKTACYWYERGLRTLPIQAAETIVNGYACFSPECLKESLIELAKISIEKNTNLIPLTVLYDWPIDEPFYVTYTAEHIQNNIDVFNQTLVEVRTELTQMEGFDTELGKQVIESVGEVPHVITDYYDDEFRVTPKLVFEDGTPFSYDGQNVALCPKFDGCNTEAQRSLYDKVACREKWWYGCNGPISPYPSYHTEDTLVSAALVGWMMADYGITGNLYWVINYSYLEGENVEDPYNLVDWGSGANGDGILVYPGKIYGVDGPVGTVRTSAILDGNEDYELIKLIQERYANRGLDSDDILARITGSLYRGSEVVGASAEYEEARSILLSVAEAVVSNSELMISSAEEKVDAAGKKTFDFVVNTAEGTELYQDETILTGENGSYHIQCGLKDAKNYLNLRAVKDGIATELSIYLGGMNEVYTADSFKPEDFAGTYTAAALQDKVYRFELDQNQKSEIKIVHDSVTKISQDTLSYVLKVQNSGGDVDYKVYITYSDYGRLEYASGKLMPGENEIVLEGFSSVNWTRNGTVKELAISVNGGEAIGISKIVVNGR